MSDIEERLRILLDYWIEHNQEHEEEFRDWAQKAAPLFTDVGEKLQEVAVGMAVVGDNLIKAREALIRSKEKH